MERLNWKNINNSEEYNRIFQERNEKEVDSQDLRRWKKLLKYFQGGKLIDLGCLDSLIPIMAKKKNLKSECWGMDYAELSIIEMRKKYPFINYEIGDILNTKFPDNYFDYAILGEVLEHLEKPALAIKEAFRILKIDGILALSTPLEEIREIGAKDKERHLWSFDAEDIRMMIKPYGEIKKIEIMGSQYFPKYVYNFPNILAWIIKK